MEKRGGGLKKRRMIVKSVEKVIYKQGDNWRRPSWHSRRKSCYKT